MSIKFYSLKEMFAVAQVWLNCPSTEYASDTFLSFPLHKHICLKLEPERKGKVFLASKKEHTVSAIPKEKQYFWKLCLLQVARSLIMQIKVSSCAIKKYIVHPL